MQHRTCVWAGRKIRFSYCSVCTARKITRFWILQIYRIYEKLMSSQTFPYYFGTWTRIDMMKRFTSLCIRNWSKMQPCNKNCSRQYNIMILWSIGSIQNISSQVLLTSKLITQSPSTDKFSASLPTPPTPPHAPPFFQLISFGLRYGS